MKTQMVNVRFMIYVIKPKITTIKCPLLSAKDHANYKTILYALQVQNKCLKKTFYGLGGKNH